MLTCRVCDLPRSRLRPGRAGINPQTPLRLRPVPRARRTMQTYRHMFATYEAPLCARLAAPLRQPTSRYVRARQARLVCAQLIDTPSPSNDQGIGAKQYTAGRRQQAAQALSIGVEHQDLSGNVDASAPAEDNRSGSSAADDLLLTISAYAINAGVLGSVALAAASGSGVLEPVAGLQAYGTAVHDAYCGLLASHPVGLKATVSGLVFALGDLTAQAYEGAGVGSVDWGRTARSGAVGLIQGPLGHTVFSSDGCLIDRFVEQQGLEEWQQPLAKIAIDQTVLSLAWNSMYFGMLGAMRMDPPGQMLDQLWSSGFSLMKAGWRLWPLAHVITYGLVPAEHRLLWVTSVELAWVSTLLFWSRQTALNDDGEADTWAAPATAAVVAAAAEAGDDAAAPQMAMERSPSQEMRVLLMDSMDGDMADESDSSMQPAQSFEMDS